MYERCKLCVTTLYMVVENERTLVSGKVSGTSLLWVSKSEYTLSVGVRQLPLNQEFWTQQLVLSSIYFCFFRLHLFFVIVKIYYSYLIFHLLKDIKED